MSSLLCASTLVLASLAATAGVDQTGAVPPARPPLVLATCYQHKLPADAGGLDRVSMQLADTLRAQEAPLVAAHVTDSFMASLGVCDRRAGGAAGAAQCRIYQMCSRLDAMDADTQFIRPGATRPVAVAKASPPPVTPAVTSGVTLPVATLAAAP